MKNSICFTGFTGRELELLQQQVSGLGDIWDCDFNLKGEAVLLAITDRPYDVVVAVVHLSDMSGAELLHHVGKLKPNTLRIAVGDLADQSSVINYIGGPHRFVARPFEPKELVSVVRRSLALDAWLASDQLRALLPKLKRLPSVPSTYFEVLKEIESPTVTVQDVGEVIAKDPAATARLLQMVNSAAFALAERVTDPVEAVSHLGLETVKSLVLCLQVFSENESLKQSGVSLEQLWDHSLAVAQISRQVMLHLTSAPRLANDAFTAGLLHDIGRIILATNLPKAYAEILESSRQRPSPLHIEEIRHFGINHTQVGAYMLGVWGMPVGLVEAAALHHAPSHAATNEISLLTAVHVANVLAYEQNPRSDGLPQPMFDEGYLAKLGLPSNAAEWQKLLSGESGSEPQISSAEVPETDVEPAANLAGSAADVVAETVWGGPVKALIAAVAVLLVLVVSWRLFHH